MLASIICRSITVVMVSGLAACLTTSALGATATPHCHEQETARAAPENATGLLELDANPARSIAGSTAATGGLALDHRQVK
jgi:hypothetical protein